jgi:heme/copper-type cytochrome/quinol oxidase subunit 2
MLRAVTTLRAGRMPACLAIGAVLLVSACGGSSSGTPSTPSGSPSAQGRQAKIVVSVKDGKVVPKAHRVKVAEGSQVQLLVSSDVDDEVHVHGYDIEKEVAAGQSVTIDFTANQTGVFEVETHESDLLLLQLQVQ